MKIKVCEIFESLQGEGSYAGIPMLFIRTSGCTRACLHCDSKYHSEGEIISVDEVVEKIKNSKLDYVCWTGGEPLLWRDEIYETIGKTIEKKHYIETNGDLLVENDFKKFCYLGVSPKDRKTAVRTIEFKKFFANFDVKIVTDLESIGIDLLKYASLLMPLTTFSKKDKKIQQKVWNYCIEHNLRFSPRLHIRVWSGKRGI